MKEKAKITIDYRNEILNKIQVYIKASNTINDIIIAGDYNQSIALNKIKHFYNNIGIKDIYQSYNNILIEELDKTYISRLIPIDSIAATLGILEYIEGCILLNHNNIVLSNHRAHIGDINFKEYFNE